MNHEFEVLYEFMEKLPGTLKPGGRVAILTFHSGEDKLVKKALKAGYREGVYSEYAKDVVRPSAEECAQNGRARSTSKSKCRLIRILTKQKSRIIMRCRKKSF